MASFRRKIFRNACKKGLEMKGFCRPNKLKWHREHGTKIEKYGNDFINGEFYKPIRKRSRKVKR